MHLLYHETGLRFEDYWQMPPRLRTLYRASLRVELEERSKRGP